MKTIAKFHVPEAWSGLGILVGVAMLLAGVVSDDWGTLALPAIVLLVPSLLHGMR